jgi:hypothetical protein
MTRAEVLPEPLKWNLFLKDPARKKIDQIELLSTGYLFTEFDTSDFRLKFQ